MAICLDFDWQTNEFMLYCRTTQLREKTMLSYEQTLRLFEKWCKEEQDIIASPALGIFLHCITSKQKKKRADFSALNATYD